MLTDVGRAASSFTTRGVARGGQSGGASGILTCSQPGSPSCTPSARCSSGPARWSTPAGSKARGSPSPVPAATRVVTAYDLDLAMDRPVTGACLVGAVVQAGGGPATVRSQLVQRTLDLTWHALREDPSRPVRWCPGPRMRMMQVLELTYWNDAPERTQGDVVTLLRAARETADDELRRCRAERVVLSTP